MSKFIVQPIENWKVDMDNLYHELINEVIADHQDIDNEEYYMDEFECFNRIKKINQDYENCEGKFWKYYNHAVYDNASEKTKVIVLHIEILKGTRFLTERVKVSGSQEASAYPLEIKRQEFVSHSNYLDKVNWKKLRKLWESRLTLINMELEDYTRVSAETTAIFLYQLYPDLIDDIESSKEN